MVHSKNLTVELNSLDARQFPAVYANYFTDWRDYDNIIYSIYKLREIFHANKSIFSHELFPRIAHSEYELRDIIHRKSALSGHAVATVSMGGNSDYAVDSKCAVRGVNGLRVADASIWPFIRNGGTQSLVFMIGEKCASYIIDDNKNSGSKINLENQINRENNKNIWYIHLNLKWWALSMLCMFSIFIILSKNGIISSGDHAYNKIN
eukprot:UN07092